jgi:hypothetical protein
LRGNVYSFKKLSTLIKWDEVDWLQALQSFSIFFAEIGLWNDAASSGREVLETRQRILGDEHPDAITAMGSLSVIVADQGRLDEAASMMREVLEERQRILGDEHPDTIAAMNTIVVIVTSIDDNGDI